MMFEITLRKSDGSTVLQETVNAYDPNSALSTVLEKFRSNPIVADAQSWDVSIKSVDVEE